MDPMLDRTEEPRDTGLTTDELLSDDTPREKPGMSDTRERDDLAPDDMARDDLARDDLARDDLARDDMAHDDAARDDLAASRTNGANADDLRGDPGATAGTTSASTGAGSGATPGDDTADERAPLVSRDRADQYASRWNEVKGMFVDEPRQAVQQADALVGDLLDDLEQLFRAQRQEIEQGLDNDDTSTEDLRMALRRYRSFFDRLLAV